jgi:hypothetical protein
MGGTGLALGTLGCPESLARPGPAMGADLGRCARLISPGYPAFRPGGPEREAAGPPTFRAPAATSARRAPAQLTSSRGSRRPGTQPGSAPAPATAAKYALLRLSADGDDDV